MTQDFYIRQKSTLPVLRIELIEDGRYDFHKNHIMNNALRGAKVTFSMINTENGVYHISKAPVDIAISADSGCEEKVILEYKWKPRDVKEKGIFKGIFEITFPDDLSEEGYEYPSGKLIVPIGEDLLINII